jgi:hypothetical protein
LKIRGKDAPAGQGLYKYCAKVSLTEITLYFETVFILTRLIDIRSGAINYSRESDKIYWQEGGFYINFWGNA